ncbi:MAG TPA: hypothetical protein VGD67_18235 [Pseudonocardiaceae bacterium]
MRRRVMGILAAFGLAAASVVLGSGTAHAATWTVTPVGPYSAASTTTLVLTDTSTGTQLNCTSGTASGQAGPVVVDRLATITGSTWSNCSGPSGITFNVAHAGTWAIHGLSHSGGVTQGTIRNIAARLSGPFCSATVSGTVNGNYTNGTGILNVVAAGSTLRISNVSGCFGLLRNGDGATFVGSYRVTPAFTVGYTP